MGSYKLKPSRMLIVLTTMALLLPLMAGLQYYWLGQVSRAESERLQSSLRTSASAFRKDFNLEFIRAYLNFHMDSFTPATELSQYHLDRLQRWNQTAPYPRLISDVFVARHDEEDRSSLRRLDPQNKRLEAVEWPEYLAKLRQRLDLEAIESRTGPGSRSSLESYAEEIPALIVPFPPNPTQTQAESSQFPSGFTIIKLDLEYMRREFIPALIHRHFLDDSQAPYDIAIISLNSPQRVIYSSHQPMSDIASSDVSTRVFGLEADELDAFLRTEGMRSAVTEQPGIQQRRLLKLRLLKRPADPITGSSSDEDGRWQLLIRHRAGSLAAAVNSARWRNLAISFGILVLLGAGIIMTAISIRRAERLARQQINFVAGVTHELRTPLAVICSAGENLADGIVDGPEKVAQYGDVVYKEGRRLADMVEQVLEFAGAQSGRQRYEFRPIEVADFIGRAVAGCQSQIEETGSNVETTIEPNLPSVNGDHVALRRAMQNLISNAIKYDGKNGWTRISAQLSGGKHGSEIEITVEDRGIGIDSADIPHIFEPFYRGHEAVAAQIQGSGVGLSLVKQIVEAHGGTLSVKSAPGVGSAFTLHLPV